MSDASDPQQRVLSRATLIARFGRPRDRRLVFTNGVFDIVHSGHVRYLVQARALGDALVVGVNSDASVRRLKGPERPVNGQAQRALLIAALACVDAVCVFEEDTPRELIARLLPDLLVKGGDYSIEQVVGREEVEAAGGSVRVLPFHQGHSTSDIIQRIRHGDTA